MNKIETTISKLTEEGYLEFQDFLNRNKQVPSGEEPPYHILKDAEPIKFTNGEYVVTNQIFSTRKELGKYISDMLYSEEDLSLIIDDKYVGAFLSLLFFPSICRKLDGNWDIKAISRYISSTNHRVSFYRNHIFAPIAMYYLHGDNADIFLCQPPYIHPDTMEQIAGRDEMISNPNVIQVAHKLYWDEVNNKVKTGAQSMDPVPDGGLRRFVGPGSFTEQHELTRDFWSLTADEIMQLLPSEFFDGNGEIRTSYGSSGDE